MVVLTWSLFRSSPPLHFLQYRIKPMPDPNRDEQETKWLSKYELDCEAKKPSFHWIETGSGSLGKVYFELIGCDNLPNLDASVTGRNKTDAFACIVFEDCIAHTEVINDTLSPRWMPWTQRAFVFNIMHPSSQLRIGVFDYDEAGRAGVVGPNYDKVGKVNVDITNCCPGTTYTLTYDIVTRTNGNHVVNGTITFRLRVEMKSQRDVLFTALRPIPSCFVSVRKKKEFGVTRYSIDGEVSTFVVSAMCVVVSRRGNSNKMARPTHRGTVPQQATLSPQHFKLCR